MSQKNTNTGAVTPTVTNMLEEAEGAKVALAAEATAVVQAVAETVQLLDFHLKKK